MRRYFLILLAIVGLSACTSITPQNFTHGFKPVVQRITQFESANALRYHPRVHTQGIRAVNNAVNAMPFLPDRNEKHKLRPEKFWSVGGDCDEYALIKMLELRAQDITDTYYMVLADRSTNILHAVLIVNDQGRMVVLDNHTDALNPLSVLYRTHQPVYFVESKTGQVWRANASAFSGDPSSCAHS